MIEHHFVVVYNQDTGHYYLDEEDIYGVSMKPVYDTSLGRLRQIHPSEDKEVNAASGWLSAALNKLSDETTKVGHL